MFVTELHSSPVQAGPGLIFSALIPDKHHFKGSEGGRTLPLLHPDGTPNLAPGLLRALSTAPDHPVAAPDHPVAAPDVLAYVAGVVSHPGFTSTFADELTTPGIRVPLTADPALWAEAVALGEQVIWLHTYSERFTGPDRPAAAVRYPRGDPRQPLSRTAIGAMPEVMTYAVGGKNVLKSWFNYRKKVPGGKKTSPLDLIHVENWDADWTTELIDLLTVLTRLVALEPAQADLLDRVIAGPVHTLDSLRAVGVRWPTTPGDRRPHRGFEARHPDAAPQLDLGS